jgi:hypothetical protein
VSGPTLAGLTKSPVLRRGGGRDAPGKFVNVVDDLSADDHRARLTFDRRVLAIYQLGIGCLTAFSLSRILIWWAS